MKQEQKIERIRAKCQEILELGKLRTQGKWMHHDGMRIAITVDDTKIPVLTGYEYDIEDRDLAFIASCAGTAEAMARSTIEAIDAALIYQKQVVGQVLLDCILKAWPDELL